METEEDVISHIVYEHSRVVNLLQNGFSCHKRSESEGGRVLEGLDVLLLKNSNTKNLL